ncbi:hypothetical protein [Agitococcus lubricus]|uniref:Phycobilisome protein n=1 Tax=Agitococcus lubricus TaxID=1077255 RepID=A0A2T5IRX4_9GAMM|nr:hypothetical protein [Agitococcus lubricus]PTQ86569.1 phycobilisome protein [Agitococcus lubricus]
MPIPVLEPTSSLRKHPEIADIFKQSENRHFTEEEFVEYLRCLPEHSHRVTAAREIAAAEQGVVERVVNEIFMLYPFEKKHAYSRTKCLRDIRSVSCYATLAMLMNDPHWYRDKLLLWLRTILQALYFPEREIVQRKTLFGSQDDNELQDLAPNQKAIYETYTKLKNNYRERLSPESFSLFEKYLQQTIDTLSSK